MKEYFDEDAGVWYPKIDLTSEERQFKDRHETGFKFWGGPIDHELKELEEVINRILRENPGLTRDRITISSEAYPVPYEDYYEGTLSIDYYTPETDDEWKSRIDYRKLQEDHEYQEYLRLKEKYQDR